MDAVIMKMLFEIDLKDYDKNGSVCVRPSVRAIICRDGLYAMIHSLKYDYYKFPGGGIENGEDHTAALVREVKEETGLTVISGTVREYGMVHRIQKGLIEDVFIQDNYYYLCSVNDEQSAQDLDDYEADEQFTLEYVTAEQALDVNRTHSHNGCKDSDIVMIDRESRVLDTLISPSGE